MTLHFNQDNGPVDETIRELIELAGKIHHPEIVREMILAALKAGLENGGKADLKLMNSTLKEMRFTSKIFGAYRNIRKVTVFGSARTKPEEPIYRMAHAFGKRLVEAGYMVITGGGPGIMHAANEGAGTQHSFGVNIRLPFEQRSNPVLDGSPRNITYKYFFNRKVAFIKEAHAIALFPGGFGTHDEAMETLTLLQTGKRDPLPLVLLDMPGGTYWAKWVQFLKKELLSQGYVGEKDFALFEQVDSEEEGVKAIDRFYHRYHSIRYVGDRLVMRLTSEINPSRLRDLRKRFADILSPGGDIVPSGPLPEESDQPEVARFPRLIVNFNRKDFGRLRQFIDAVNE